MDTDTRIECTDWDEAGVANREQLRVAVPALVALQAAERSLQLRAKETRAVIQALSDACSAYARRHHDYVFDQTFSVSPIGVESGDIEVDGRTYHFTHGFDGYVRTEQGETLTQEFLKGLPEGWAKPRLQLDTTALNKAKLKDRDLAEFGLMHKVKDAWFET